MLFNLLIMIFYENNNIYDHCSKIDYNQGQQVAIALEIGESFFPRSFLFLFLLLHKVMKFAPP